MKHMILRKVKFALRITRFAILSVGLGGVLASPLYAQEAYQCFAGIPETAGDDEFVTFESGDVWHKPSNLVWMRCSIGQTFNGESCLGEAEPLTWQQALQTSLGYEHNGSSNWRLPNVKELSALTERACVRPAININLFPDTRADDYWTSTPSMIDAERAWVVAFFNGSNSIKQKDRTVFVRLVRTALPDERVE